MYDEHWSDDQLIDRLYGVGPESGHIERCPSCASRWEEIRRRSECLRQTGMEVSEGHLASQRRAIRARLSEKRHLFPRVLVPVVVTLVVAVFVILDRHAPAPRQEVAPQSVDTISDDQLFDDVFSRISGAEPSSIVPIRSLFEEKK